MKRVKLTVAYDGTNYRGWQIQPNGITIEEILNEAISRLTGEEIKVIGASRTDAGVHAEGNVAVFDTASAIPPERFAYALNPMLPEDIVVVKSEKVSEDWHPRYRDSVKTYEYRILNREMPDPLRRSNVWHVSFPLDVEQMRLAASYFVGEHDFKNFCNIHTGAKTTVRTIFNLDLDRTEDLITIRISGNGFLYNMVRIITGTLVEVGRKFRTPETIKELLEVSGEGKAGVTAPPQGLMLKRIQYIGE